MKITNDIVTFTAEDFAGLSDHAKKAILVYLEDYAAYFSAKVNREIELAKAHLKTLAVADPATSAIIDGLVSADAAKLAQAEPLLVQLDAILNPVEKPVIEALAESIPAEAPVAEAQPETTAEAPVAEAQPEPQPEATVSEEPASLWDKVTSVFK